MKKLHLTALSLISALGLAAGVSAQEAQPAPELDTPLATEAPEAQSAHGESLADWDAARLSELGGETLKNADGESLGEIQEFVRSTDDDQVYAVVSSEDPLRIDDMTTVSVSDITLQDEDVIYTGDRAELERMFDEEPYQEARYQPLEEGADQRV